MPEIGYVVWPTGPLPNYFQMVSPGSNMVPRQGVQGLNHRNT